MALKRKQSKSKAKGSPWFNYYDYVAREKRYPQIMYTSVKEIKDDMISVLMPVDKKYKTKKYKFDSEILKLLKPKDKVGLWYVENGKYEDVDVADLKGKKIMNIKAAKKVKAKSFTITYHIPTNIPNGKQPHMVSIGTIPFTDVDEIRFIKRQYKSDIEIVGIAKLN